MGILDSYKDLINASFSKWIKVEDNQSKWTIEDFPYNTGVDEDITKPHCWKCVTVNKCWFKNEENKKPKRFDYTLFTYSQIMKMIRGLYHPKCHCKEFAINVPKEKDIELRIKDGKIKNFFKVKSGWYYSWGYVDKDKNDFINMFKELIIDAYRQGNYYEEKHTKAGYQINLTIKIPGKNEKLNKEYEVKSAFIIFPEGKLRCITLVGGWQK